jgi:NAD(P)-dependent dehydrogenase (short-subunit alcohol dehydrogenase family)
MALRLAPDHDLILTDRDASALDRVRGDLAGQGFDCETIAGDATEAAFLADLCARVAAGGAPFGVVHAAGISPTSASWQGVLTVNLLATARLLAAVEPLLVPGSVVVPIASMAGYLVPADAARDLVLEDCLAPDFFARLEPYLTPLVDPADAAGLGTPAYRASKRGVLRICQNATMAFGARGSRIVTVSPSLVLTAMGRAEAANSNVQGLADATPLGRITEVADVVSAIAFLLSDEASFITGCDLRVDGGMIAKRVGPVLNGATGAFAPSLPTSGPSPARPS